MSLHIDDPEAETLARELAKRTGLPVSQAVIAALRAQLALASRRSQGDLNQALAVARRCSQLPDLDTRPAEEILGYNQRGTWD